MPTARAGIILRVFPAKEQRDHDFHLTRLGARVVSDRRPELGWVVLADPEGNEFCVEISAAGLRAAQAAEAAS